MLNNLALQDQPRPPCRIKAESDVVFQMPLTIFQSLSSKPSQTFTLKTDEKSKVCVQVNRTDSRRRTRSVNPLRTIILVV